MGIGIVFIAFAFLLVITVPVSMTLAIVSMLPKVFDSNFPGSFDFILRGQIGGVDSFPVLAIPLFILSGIIMARGGISKKLFDVFAYFLGNVTAGMPTAVIITCLFYGAISGSGPATTAAVGSMTIPILVNLGYAPAFATAICAVAGGLGVIIPPSIPFVLYGMASGASVGQMFVAGVVPGSLIALCLIGYSYIYCKFKGEDKEKIRANTKRLRSQGVVQVFTSSFWALLSPIIILGSIYSGIASPTEAATISVFYALFTSIVIYKTLEVNQIYKIVVESVKTYTPILYILAAAMAFARVLALLNVPAIVSQYMTSTFTDKIILLLVINVFLLLVGMVIDTGPAILILTPILLPIVKTIGIHPIHFGIIMVVNLAIGFVTPPLGVNLFVASSLTDLDIMDIAKEAFPFVVAFLIALMLITFIPMISLALI